MPVTPEYTAWVSEMAAYVKQTDPNRHLVSTTYGDEATWKVPDVDLSMTHLYGQAGNTADFTDRSSGKLHARPSGSASPTCWPNLGSTGKPATSVGTRKGPV